MQQSTNEGCGPRDPTYESDRCETNPHRRSIVTDRADDRPSQPTTQLNTPWYLRFARYRPHVCQDLTGLGIRWAGGWTRNAVRLEKLLEDASIKLYAVASSVTNVWPRATLAELVAGNRGARRCRTWRSRRGAARSRT